jgi:hypothetical protein
MTVLRHRFMDQCDAANMADGFMEGIIYRKGLRRQLDQALVPNAKIEYSHNQDDGSQIITLWVGPVAMAQAVMVRDTMNFTVLSLVEFP